MGNKPLDSSDYDGNRTNRSCISSDSNKIITSMLQRVHTQMEYEQTGSVHSNEKSAIRPLNNSAAKQEFADTQQLFQNSPNQNDDEFGIENYFSANEHNEGVPSISKGKDNFANYGAPLAINSILSKNIPGKPGNIQQPRINCNLQQSLFTLPNNVIYLIISFLIDNYNSLVSISPVWYYKINEVMEESLVDVDNDFIKKHMEFLSLKKSYFSITPLKLSKLGFRLDRNIVAEVFPSLEGKTVMLRYYYELKNKTMNCVEFRFDVVRKGGRKIWVYKENFKHNYDQNKIGFVQPIIPIFCDENIKLAINFYNPKGLIDIRKIAWDSPIIEQIPKIQKSLTTNTMRSRFEIDRLCELEAIHGENDWIDPKYLENRGGVPWDVNRFEPQLKFLEIKSAGIETSIISSRIQFKATQLGVVDDCYSIFGVNVEIVSDNDECLNEVKRCGLVFDLEETLQLKVGDILVFYVSGGA